MAKDRFSSDRALSNRELKDSITFVYENRHHLRRADPTNHLTLEAERLYKLIMDGGTCSDRDRKMFDKLYERTMKGAGIEHVDEHKDRRKKGLRFGH